MHKVYTTLSYADNMYRRLWKHDMILLDLTRVSYFLN